MRSKRTLLICLVIGVSSLLLSPQSMATATTQPERIGTQATICDGDGISGSRVQLLYVHAEGGTDKFAEMEGTIKSWASLMDYNLLEGAQRGGGVRHVRWVHNPDCSPIVLNTSVTAEQIKSHNGIVEGLKARGYKLADRSYLVVYEAPGCGASTGENSSPSVGPNWATVGTTAICHKWSTALHELLHNLGAVSPAAPHGTPGSHCWDDDDIMCYDDGGPVKPQFLCPKAINENLVDCNNDDYFNIAPPAGTWLASHWNVANSPFLTANGPGAPVYVGSKEVVTARAGATAYVTKYQLPNGEWTAKAKIVTSSSSPFYSSVLAVRTPLGVRYVPVAGVPRGRAAYVTVEANSQLDVKLCEGNAAAKSGCSPTWW